VSRAFNPRVGIVVLLADTGERHMTTSLFNHREAGPA
jgi:hypothetical protein